MIRRTAPAETRVIRLAVRVRREQAELVLAELLELAPRGVEERDDGDVVEYAVYGAPGELPALPDLRAAAGGALVDVATSEVADDWDERWKAFHRPVRVGDLLVRPPWEPAGEGRLDIVIDPAPGVRHRRAPHDAAVPRADARARSGRPPRRRGLRLGRPGHRRRAAGLVAGARARPRPRGDPRHARQRGRQRRAGAGAPPRPAARRPGAGRAHRPGQPAAPAAAPRRRTTASRTPRPAPLSRAVCSPTRATRSPPRSPPTGCARPHGATRATGSRCCWRAEIPDHSGRSCGRAVPWRRSYP